MKGNPFFWMKKEKIDFLDTWKICESGAEMRTGILPHGVQREEETLKHFTQDIQVGGLMYRARQRGKYSGYL